MQRSVPHAHEQNGMAERMIQTLNTMARSMMLSSAAPESMWQYAIDTAAYIWNRLPNKNLDGMSPFEAATGEKPSIAHMVPFYSKGYYHLDPSERKKSAKFRAAAHPCYFIGYPAGYKNAYKILDEKTRKVVVRCDVIFDEHMDVSSSTVSDGHENGTIVIDRDKEEAAVSHEDANSQPSVPLSLPAPPEPRRNPFRAARRVGEYVDSCFTIRIDDMPDAIQHVEPVTPKNVRQALSPDNPFREYWLKAINDEVEALLERNVIESVPPNIASTIKQAFRSFMVFRVNKLPDRTYKFKARLVGDGRDQIQGIDYEDTQAPTVGFHVVMIVLHLAAIKGWYVTGCDIANAYLKALADRDLYMYLPFDYTGGVKVMVRLLRNLYGTKQAVRLWYAKIDEVMRSHGLQRSKVEPCLYYRRNVEECLYVLVYVDDILIVGNSDKVTCDFKDYLSKTITKITDLGNVNRYLGIDITREGDYFVLKQTDYIEKSYAKFIPDGANYKGKPTPLPVNIDHLRRAREEGEPEVVINDRLGTLNFAATRCKPEIGYTTSLIGSYASKATIEHVKACDRTFGYLKRVKHEGLRVGGPSKIFKPVVFVDALLQHAVQQSILVS